MKVFIDLCAGLGGASSAFVLDHEWLVIRLDNNDELKPFVPGLNVADVCDVDATLKLIEAVCRIHGTSLVDATKLVVWASPPCDEFSLAYSAKGPTARRNGEDFEPNMAIMEACLEVIQNLEPDFWYVENVRGAIPYFQDALGNWTQQVGSFFLWGKHPLIAFKDNNTRYLKKVDKRHSDMRAQLRAQIPLEISQAIKDSMDIQRSLTSFFGDAEQDA